MTKTTEKEKRTPAKAAVAKKTTATAKKTTTSAKKTTATAKKTTKEQKREQFIRESLIRQLWKIGADVEFLEDIIDDYMIFYEIKERLKADIEKRGVNYEEPAANTGKVIVKQNPSLKDLAMINRQMLSILKELGLTTEQVDPSGDEEL